MPADPPADDVLELTDLVRQARRQAITARTREVRSSRAYDQAIGTGDRLARTAAWIQSSVDAYVASLWNSELNRLVDEAKHAGLDL